MPISFNVNDILDATEQATIQRTVGANNAAQLDRAVTKLAKAAMREFADLILGKYALRPAAEVHQVRLLHLIGHYFDGRIPTELDLVGLLRIQERAATRLLDDTSARNSDALRPAYQATLQAIFDAKTPNVDGSHQVTIVSSHMLAWLRVESSRVAATYGQIFKVRGTNDRYAIPIDTYNAICDDLGLNR
jgi:hypothetical protein